MRKSRRLAIGALLAAVYLLAAALTQRMGFPLRPVFDGVAPIGPYSWVNPPSAFKKGNTPPSEASTAVPLDPSGSQAATVVTDDNQATLIVPTKTVPARSGEGSVTVHVVPLDPLKVGRPPNGLAYAGNAYGFTARYAKSGIDAPVQQGVTVLLRYPSTAIDLVRRDGGAWTRLGAKTLTATLQIYATTNTLGTFVAVTKASSRVLLWVISGLTCVLAAIVGVARGRRDRRASRSK